jgi:hypothetical protein
MKTRDASYFDRQYKIRTIAAEDSNTGNRSCCGEGFH